MRIASSFRVAAPRERVWELLLSPEALLAAMPSCEAVERVDDTVYRARLRVKVGSITFAASTETVITHREPPYRLESTTRGDDASLASSLRVESRLELGADGSDTQAASHARVALRPAGNHGFHPVSVAWWQCSRMERASPGRRRGA